MKEKCENESSVSKLNKHSGLTQVGVLEGICKPCIKDAGRH
jgi:hypothetical protein